MLGDPVEYFTGRVRAPCRVGTMKFHPVSLADIQAYLVRREMFKIRVTCTTKY